MLVFVYGSLKKGFHNHVVMEHSGGTLKGEFSTDPKYTMYSLGGFPGVVGEGNTAIKGEVYDAEVLDHLDHLEGYPTFYYREKISTPWGEAWIYLLNTIGDMDNHEVIADGVWKHP